MRIGILGSGLVAGYSGYGQLVEDINTAPVLEIPSAVRAPATGVE